MMNYIRHNKLFTSIMAVLTSVIFVLSIALIQGKEIEPSTPDIPEVIHELGNENNNPVPTIPIKNKALIKNFFGRYDNNNHMISLSWSLSKNNSVINSIHLYKDETFIADVTNASSYEMPNNMYGITTGPNLFQLKVDLEDEEDFVATSYVNLDYVMDVTKSYKFIDNSLGKGMLLQLDYVYNTNSPVGVPKINIKTTVAADIAVSHISTNENPMPGSYVFGSSSYFLDLSHFPEQSVSWEVKYIFESVGYNVESFITEDLSKVEYDETEIETKIEDVTEEKPVE